MTVPDLFVRTFALFTVGALLMALGSVRQPAAVRKTRVMKLLFYFAIVHGVLGLAMAGHEALLALIGVVLAISVWEASRAWRSIGAPKPWLLAGASVAAGAAALYAAARLDPGVFAWIFIVTAASDGFSQVMGQWLGSRPLAPGISPTKTVEGLIGGLVGALLVALWLRGLTPYSVLTAAGVGSAVAIAAVIGDLAGSFLKRRAGIKDFSSLLPGQGGVLDRFNSLIAALGLVGVWL